MTDEICPIAKTCGCCQYADVGYHTQTAEKEKALQECFKGLPLSLPMLTPDDPTHYRNKVHRVISPGKKGGIIAGNYYPGTHRVVPVSQCLIEDRKAAEIADAAVRLAFEFHLKPYDEDRGTGFLRHVLVRVGVNTGEILLILVTASPVFPGKNHFVRALCTAHPEITSIVLNVNAKDTTMVLGKETHTLFGPGFITDRIGNMTYRLSASAFYQVNPAMTKKLYDTVLDFAKLSGRETVLDAYSGVGTIGLYLSPHAQSVIAVELNPDAVRDAFKNARLNKAGNIRFIQDDATEYLKKLAASGSHIDVLVLDPPRSGSTESFIASVRKLAPDRVVYVSCNPETLVRDLKLFARQGYRTEAVKPCDMFPFTRHAESVALITRDRARQQNDCH